MTGDAQLEEGVTDDIRQVEEMTDHDVLIEEEAMADDILIEEDEGEGQLALAAGASGWLEAAT